jgi:hypothetical protein
MASELDDLADAEQRLCEVLAAYFEAAKAGQAAERARSRPARVRAMRPGPTGPGGEPAGPRRTEPRRPWAGPDRKGPKPDPIRIGPGFW